ncbi:hypothetical protein Nepgr_030352 [Nepenthes gracilis]|uniref:PPM-type phosphatase domain-containing protein n=1 Tax=Nepenthes gracilis TaxID=150966 RepID=A0AAD3TFZ3_NEPGR|nr:hypothetical protein Nepgr_030352 [Nepenthes gracilis]
MRFSESKKSFKPFMMMGLKDIHLKLKVLRLRRFLLGDARTSGEVSEAAKKPLWPTQISHGYHVVEGRTFKIDQSSGLRSDTVVVQRELIGHVELWFYGLSDTKISNTINRYMQSNLFDREPQESQIRRKSKETMRKAYLNAKAEFGETVDAEEKLTVGSASLMVINGQKLVVANIGDYRAVMCRDGMAHQLGTRHRYTRRKHWPRRFLSGAIHMPKVWIRAYNSSKEASTKSCKSSGLTVADERVDAETQFIILSSNGVWEVMKNQEAVNLIRHIDDPQEAAECLAREALTRMSKSNISCLVIRFD